MLFVEYIAYAIGIAGIITLVLGLVDTVRMRGRTMVIFVFLASLSIGIGAGAEHYRKDLEKKADSTAESQSDSAAQLPEAPLPSPVP